MGSSIADACQIPITAVREIKILRMLNHRNVLGLKDIVTDKCTSGPHCLFRWVATSIMPKRFLA